MTCHGCWARIRRRNARKYKLSDQNSPTARVIRKESLLLAGLLFLGLAVLPIAVFVVGQLIFGDYGGKGFTQFYFDLSGRIRSGDGAAIFLVLSPYLAWQTIRLMSFGWRVTRRPRAARR